MRVANCMYDCSNKYSNEQTSHPGRLDGVADSHHDSFSRLSIDNNVMQIKVSSINWRGWRRERLDQFKVQRPVTTLCSLYIQRWGNAKRDLRRTFHWISNPIERQVDACGRLGGFASQLFHWFRVHTYNTMYGYESLALKYANPYMLRLVRRYFIRTLFRPCW